MRLGVGFMYTFRVNHKYKAVATELPVDL